MADPSREVRRARPQWRRQGVQAWPEIADENVQAARDELSSVRRALQVYGLPDVWAHHAIDRIDAADHMLGGPRPFNLRDLEDDLPPLGPQYFG